MIFVLVRLEDVVKLMKKLQISCLFFSLRDISMFLSSFIDVSPRCLHVSGRRFLCTFPIDVTEDITHGSFKKGAFFNVFRRFSSTFIDVSHRCLDVSFRRL